MEPLAAQGPNAEQITYWNETGTKWVQLHDLLDAQLQSLGRRTMDAAGLGTGQRVLDVGCGCGATSLDLARRVGPTGTVTGIDISSVMLGRARARATEAGAANLHFENADAQTHAFAPASFERVFSRFGVMFFSDPRAAFANLRSSLAAGGCLGFVCWRAMAENPWLLLPTMAAASHLPLPPPPPADAPGPFAFADAERVRSILAAAGFDDIACTAIDETLAVAGGADLDQSVSFLMQFGPAAPLIRDADAAVQEIIRDAVRAALMPFRTTDGVRVPAAAWIFTARRP